MTDKFTCCPIDRLLDWILTEEKTGQIFGIHKDLFFVPDKDDPFKISRYGQILETPIGVAAGPHTQLSQNIISAWLTGARYIELKTVQTLDELDVTKPCIDMADEGYNCEWSQELKLEQSFSEYLNAWIIIHLLKDKFGWGNADAPGFIFNMSVGYNLEGILSPNVQLFLSRMEDCRKEKELRIKQISKLYPRIMDLDIPDRMSDNLTISTMHGCPPDEIGKIARYFIKDRKLNTTIKLNPTLLGPEKLRYILNDRLCYNVEVPDLAFDHDLKYDAGVSLIRKLLDDASSEGVSFNLKLTNTLETTNLDQNLPDNEKMVYMSGRALHPISVNLARKLQDEFDGKLDISFSAGSDCFNISDILACNIAPITVCSDILKPGGYGRISQYIEQIKSKFQKVKVKSINEFIQARNKNNGDSKQEGFHNLVRYSESVIDNKQYHKSIFPFENIKTERELTVFDCVKAPCVTTCPANQNVPRYMYHTAKGEYEEAWHTILDTNPLPNIQGMVCDQQCRTKCTRMNYDNPLLIREIKRFVAQRHNGGTVTKSAPTNGIKVAVIGAGPSGLSCAHFLVLNGFSVDIYESKKIPGGMAADCIPIFRLDKESLKKDIDAILSLGVGAYFEERIDNTRFEQLRASYDYIYIAVGAGLFRSYRPSSR
ncbi:NAD(P)-binding protein, partial [Thermodesulfobacteriota bacterium]